MFQIIATNSQNWHDYQFILDWINNGKKYHPKYVLKKINFVFVRSGCRYEHVGTDVIHTQNVTKAKTLNRVLQCIQCTQNGFPNNSFFFAGMIIFKLAGWARRAEFISQIKHFNCRPKSFCSYLFLKVLMNFKPSEFWIIAAVQNSYI